MWIYAGLPPPKSIIIPHVLSVTLPQGPFTPRMNPEKYRQLLGSHRGLIDPDPAYKILCRNLAKQLKRSKVDFVRCWFQWNLFQPSILRGKEQHYEFPLDHFVDEMNKEGIEIVAVIGNGYFRFLPKRLNIDQPTEYLARLSESSTEIVRHYSGRIAMWQIENEPNWWLEHFSTDWRRGGIWFEKNISELILSELKRIVNEEDHGTPIMINLEADSAKTSSNSFSKYCDVLGLDYYPNYSHATPINVSEIKVATEAKKIAGKPVMIAETGYPSGPKLFGYNEQNQAEYVRAACEEAFSCDGICGLAMWRLSDTYWLSFPFQENNFGLLDRRGSPKKAWFEYENQIKTRRK